MIVSADFLAQLLSLYVLMFSPVLLVSVAPAYRGVKRLVVGAADGR